MPSVGPRPTIGRDLPVTARRRSERARAACRSAGRRADTCCPIVAASAKRARRCMRRHRRRRPAGIALSAPASAITGTKRSRLANRLRNASSRPKITDGRKIVQSSPDAATIASASPLLRRYRLGPAGSALSALMWMSRRTPRRNAGRDHGAREDRRAPSGTCRRPFRSGFRRD